ncbi:MAG: 16S rRNA (guanine(966)-N(2))-methyltransferase RsmD [Lachnospiraceae bacterium]|nr:16S rRNA (guanine(966)-N(2))-methyltransferase RsmD [Lachnospiraceae bacterium]
MRVIAGEARRIQLKTPVGNHTRPTTDRIKETLFNILSPHLADAVFLDLFSGSGGIGIEAISRGAKKAVFVENNKEALSCIKDNLSRTHFTDRANVLSMDCFGALKVLAGRDDVFDVIFMDPPYDCGYEKKVLEYLTAAEFITEDTWIVFEASLHTDIDYLTDLGYDVIKVKEYKTNKHIFVKRENK